MIKQLSIFILALFMFQSSTAEAELNHFSIPKVQLTGAGSKNEKKEVSNIVSSIGEYLHSHPNAMAISVRAYKDKNGNVKVLINVFVDKTKAKKKKEKKKTQFYKKANTREI